MELRPYQQEDVAELMKQDAMCVFNEQRTGKTPTSIMTMQKKGVQRLLIICPASMVYKWKEEFETWTGGVASVITSAKTFNQVAKGMTFVATALIINYENLRDNKATDGAWANILKYYKPDGVIVDEAHRIKDKSTANFRAVNRFNKVKYRLALTGTPVPNKPWDIWGILHFISPTVYSSYWDFIEEYFKKSLIRTAQGTIVEEPIGFRLGKEKLLQEKLDKLAIMRKRKDVMPWLPAEEAPTVIKLPCTFSQRKYIKELEQYFETGKVVTQNVLEQLIRIRQICAAPEILDLRGSSPKIDWLKDYITDYPKKSILVFSNSKKFLYLVYESIDSQIITGDTAPQTRQHIINEFQKGGRNVLLIQTQAGKEGLTLDQADVTIFLDVYPPAADYLQAKDRMVATTPERVKPKEIIHVMMQDTYDEQLYQLVQRNVDVADVINNYISYVKARRK